MNHVANPDIPNGAGASDTAATSTEGNTSPRAPKDSAWVLFLGGLLGAYASAMLAIEYMRTLADENYVSGCDVNELIGCGQFLGTAQAQAFGFPNVVIGMLAFPVVALIGALLISRVQLPRWIEVGTVIGSTMGIGFVIWLQFQALFVLEALCPYCVVVWIAMIPIFVHTVVNFVPAPGRISSLWETLRANRWWIVAVWYLLVIAAIMLVLREQIIGLL